MEDKTFAERVLDMAKLKKRASKTQLLFMVHGEEILQALDKGLPKRWIWETLCEEGCCPPAYTRFLTQLQRFLKENRPQAQKPTPEGNATKAPVSPAPAQETVEQVSAKRLESRSFEYGAPTPEDIKKLYGEK